MTQTQSLNTQQRELIAIGASVAGNCLPCLRYHFAEAVKAGCTLKEITEAIELSKMVKERPIKDIYHLADELLQRETRDVLFRLRKGTERTRGIDHLRAMRQQ